MWQALGAHPWAYPMLEVVHVIGIGLLMGNLILLELRLWGLGAALPVRPLARLCLPLAGIGFLMAAASGLMMFATQAEELLANRAFTVKMLLLMLAAGNAAWFHGRRSLELLDGRARGLMLLSTLIWVLVVTCGRWIAYL
ncbi:MAG: hypothetical protein EP308_05310 [Burkholderiales bacterium]|nr:MAG: hypothetical protein EP308_05310 [Burkholderiales bacterium]